MSGPKISVYSLTGWARKVVDGQIQCEQKAMVCGEQIKAIISECVGMDKEIEKSLAMLNNLQQKYGGQENLIEEIRELRNSMDQEIKKIREEFSRNVPTISPKYRISDEALEEKRQKLERIMAIKKKAQALKDRLDMAAKAGGEAGKGEQKKAYQTISEYLNYETGEAEPDTHIKDVSELKSSIDDGMSGAFSFDDLDEIAEDTSFEDRKKAIRLELMELLKLDLSKQLVSEVKNALNNLDGITQIDNLTTFDSITVKKIFRDLEAYQKECEEAQKAFEEDLLRYRTLCELAGKNSETEREFANVDELETAIQQMEAIITKQKEQAYISDCVDEVMKDMGYDLIGRREVKKKSGKQFRNELFQFDEGTAVNITYSSDGQISMELGGIAKEDRIPSDDEMSVLTKDMETFCSEFSEFERRMKDKGIIVGNRIALMPPTKDYAAIINVSDYSIEEGKQITEMNVETRRKKTATAQKVLRRDE